jgi:hypothetical protein
MELGWISKFSTWGNPSGMGASPGQVWGLKGCIQQVKAAITGEVTVLCQGEIKAGRGELIWQQ